MTEFTSQKYKSLISNGVICLLLLLFFADYFFDFNTELIVVTAFLGISVIIIFMLRYKQLLLYGLSFIIPISVPFAIGTSEINVPSELIVSLLSGFFIVKFAIGKKPDAAFLTHPVTILILLDLAWIFLSSVFSELPQVSFKRFVIRSFYYISFFYFYYELFKQNLANIKKAFTLHITGFLVPIAYSFVNHANLGFTTVGSQRISAPFYFDHTIYGACLVFFIPFILIYFLNAPKRKEKFFYGILLFIFIVSAILSYSRAAWISLLIAALFGVILKYKVKVKHLGFAVAIVLLAAVFNWKNITTSLSENKEISHSNNVGMHFKSISNINTDASNKERINRWKCALRMFADKPLFGFGPGTYQFFYGRYQRQEDITRISTYSGNKGHAHSEYLSYLSETGLPGLLIFVTLNSVVCIKALRLYRNSNTLLNRHIILFVIPGLITYFIHAFFNGFLEFDKMAMPVFTYFAAIVALDTRLKNRPDEITTNKNS